MKIISGLFIAHILLMSAGCSQTNKIDQGYAFARPVLSGVNPKASVAENGSIVEKSSKAGMQYLIYVVTTNTSFLSVKNILINGEKYYASAEAVNDFPVVVPDNNSGQEHYDTLLAASKFKTWKINVGQIVPSPDTGTINNNADVMVGVLSKDKMHYYSIGKIKYLEPVRLQ